MLILPFLSSSVRDRLVGPGSACGCTPTVGERWRRRNLEYMLPPPTPTRIGHIAGAEALLGTALPTPKRVGSAVPSLGGVDSSGTPNSWAAHDGRYARYKTLMVTTHRGYSMRLISSSAVPSRKLRHEGQDMRDLLADWRKWSSVERLLAMVLILVLIGLPLRILITVTSF